MGLLLPVKNYYTVNKTLKTYRKFLLESYSFHSKNETYSNLMRLSDASH